MKNPKFSMFIGAALVLFITLLGASIITAANNVVGGTDGTQLSNGLLTNRNESVSGTPHDGESMNTSNFGFNSGQYTSAPLQTEGWIRFTDPPDKVFEFITNNSRMVEWVPLLMKVTVTQPPTLPPGESTVGTTRTLVFQGGITLVERVVQWKPPLYYAYSAEGKGVQFPLQNYIGLMGVEPGKDRGGTFIFREYFNLNGVIQNAVIPYGDVLAIKRTFGKLSKLINGTESDVWHVTT